MNLIAHYLTDVYIYIYIYFADDDCLVVSFVHRLAVLQFS